MSLEISFHPEAAVRWDALARELLAQVKDDHPSPRKHPSEGMDWSLSHTENKLSQSDIIGSIRLVRTDIKEEHSYTFHGNDGRAYILDRHALERVTELATNIHKSKSLRETSSERTIQRLVLDWVEQSYCEGSDQSLSSFIAEKVGPTIVEREIWVPIVALTLQKSIKMGRVMLSPISKDIVDRWCEYARSMYTSNPAELERYCGRLRTKYQNTVAAIVHVTGEPKFARDRAMELTEEALSMIRIMSPANLDPEFNCNVVPEGRLLLRTNKLLEVKNGLLQSQVGELDKSDTLPWAISSAQIDGRLSP